MRLTTQFVLLALLIGAANKLSATMIVMIYTKDGVWLAADGYRSSDHKHLEDVCKIHETTFGLIVKSGTSQGTRSSGESYSTDKEVEDQVAQATDLSDLQVRLRVRFKDDIEEELAFLIDNPRITKQYLPQSPMDTPVPEWLILRSIRSIITVDTNKPAAPASALLVEAASKHFKNGDRDFFTYWAPAMLNWHPVDDPEFPVAVTPHPIIMPKSMRQFSNATSYLKDDAWTMENPEKAIREVLDKGHAEHPTDIGPPLHDRPRYTEGGQETHSSLDI